MTHEDILKHLQCACSGSYHSTVLRGAVLMDYISMGMAWGMTKEEMVKRIYDHTTLSMKDCQRVVDEYEEMCNKPGRRRKCLDGTGTTRR